MSSSRKQSDTFAAIVDRGNNFLHSGSADSCTPFIIDGMCVGLVRKEYVTELIKYSIFNLKVTDNGSELHLRTKSSDVDGRSKEVDEALEDLRRRGCCVGLNGWRDETYCVKQTFSSANLLNMERSATGLFGVIQYGTHLNGYLYDSKGELHMWIARRSDTKQTFPGFLDNICAGGLPSNMGIRECMVKEAQEEAGLVFNDDIQLKPVGTISYFYEDERGVFPECQFVFDVELPSSFVPENMDKEVQGFQLLPIQEVLDKVAADKFAFYSAIVVLDFCIRHGVISSDSEPRYAYLVEQMHVPLQTMYKKRQFTLR